MCETPVVGFSRDGVKLGLSLSHILGGTVGVGVGPKSRFGRDSLARDEIENGGGRCLTDAAPTLLLYGVQSVYNGRCHLTCLYTLCTPSFTPNEVRA